MSGITRQFDIIQALRGARQPLTAHALADELGVSIRTIYRDIGRLQAARVPIEGEAGIGYMMRSGFDVPALALDQDEIDALVVGLSMVDRTGDASLSEVAARVRRKLASAIDPADTGEASYSGTLASGWHAVASPAVDPGTIRAAIHGARKISMTYRNEKGDESTRIIRPVALVYYIEAMVVAAWCELRADFRHFRLDRIMSMTVLDDSFSDEAANLRETWQDYAAPVLAPPSGKQG